MPVRIRQRVTGGLWGEKNRRGGVIAGLGEAGGPEDAELPVRWLPHPRVRGRVEAIRALRRLGVTRPHDLLPLLRDESGAVTRQAVAALRPEIAALDLVMLDALLSRESTTRKLRFHAGLT